jgi:hypothetical protein
MQHAIKGIMPSIPAGFGAVSCAPADQLDLKTAMTTPPVRVCPLCGSDRVTIREPNAIQARSGVAHVLRCECGAIITLSILRPSDAISDGDKVRSQTPPK